MAEAATSWNNWLMLNLYKSRSATLAIPSPLALLSEFYWVYLLLSLPGSPVCQTPLVTCWITSVFSQTEKYIELSNSQLPLCTESAECGGPNSKTVQSLVHSILALINLSWTPLGESVPSLIPWSVFNPSFLSPYPPISLFYFLYIIRPSPFYLHSIFSQATIYSQTYSFISFLFTPLFTDLCRMFHGKLSQ